MSPEQPFRTLCHQHPNNARSSSCPSAPRAGSRFAGAVRNQPSQALGTLLAQCMADPILIAETFSSIRPGFTSRATGRRTARRWASTRDFVATRHARDLGPKRQVVKERPSGLPAGPPTRAVGRAVDDAPNRWRIEGEHRLDRRSRPSTAKCGSVRTGARFPRTRISGYPLATITGHPVAWKLQPDQNKRCDRNRGLPRSPRVHQVSWLEVFLRLQGSEVRSQRRPHPFVILGLSLELSGF